MKIRCEDMFSLERIKIVKLLEHSAPDLIQSWEAPAIENSDSQHPTWNYRQGQWWGPPVVENPKISFVILGLSDQPLQPIRHLIHQIFKRVEGVVCLKWDGGAGGRGHHYGFDLRDTLKDHLFNNPQISNLDYVALNCVRGFICIISLPEAYTRIWYLCLTPPNPFLTP